MLGLLKKLFGGKTAEATSEAPYKVEAPKEASQPAQSFNYEDVKPKQVILTPSDAPVAEAATQAMVELVAPAKKPRAKKPAATNKPAAAKKPRKPKTAKS